MSAILLRLLLFLLPVVLLVLWLRAVAKRKDGMPADTQRTSRWQAAAGGAILLAVGASLAVFALTREQNIDETYTPPRLEDGKAVPGRVD